MPGLGGVLPLRAGGGLVLLRVEGAWSWCPPAGSRLWSSPGTRQNAGWHPPETVWHLPGRVAARENAGVSHFVGRAEPLARLTAAYRAARRGRGGRPGRAGLVLVTGEAGIGKTALLTRFAADVAGAAPPWSGAPAGTATRRRPGGRGPRRCGPCSTLRDGLADAGRPELAAIAAGARPPHRWPPTADGRPGAGLRRGRPAAAPAAADAPARGGPRRPAVGRPVHGGPAALPRQQHAARPLLLVGAYRPGEPPPDDRRAPWPSWPPPPSWCRCRVCRRARSPTWCSGRRGPARQPSWARLVHERSGGHPFFARELCHLLVAGGTADGVPAAVREVIGRRLGPAVRRLRRAARRGRGGRRHAAARRARRGHRREPTAVAELIGEAVAAGVLAAVETGELRFAHDLYRETIYTALPAGAPARPAPPGRRGAGCAGTSAAARCSRPSWPATSPPPSPAAGTAAGAGLGARRGRRGRRPVRVRRGGRPPGPGCGRRSPTPGWRLPDADLVGLLTAEADLRLRAGDAARGPRAARHRLDAGRRRPATPTCSARSRSAWTGSAPGSPCRGPS